MIKYNRPQPLKYDSGGKTYTPKNPIGVQMGIAPVAVGATSGILPWVLGALGITGVAATQASKNQRSVTPSLTLPAMLHMMGLANSYAHLTSDTQEGEKSQAAEQTNSTTQAAPETPKNEDNESKNEGSEKPNQQKKSFREKVSNKIRKTADKVEGKKTNDIQPPLRPNKNKGFQRWIWETKGNHFENSIGSYPWRNVGRIVGGLTVLGDGSAGRGAGKVANYGKQQIANFSKEVSNSPQTIDQSTTQNTGKILIDPGVQKELESMYEQSRDSLLQ